MVLPVSWWRWAKAKAIAAHAKPPLEKLPKGIPLPSFLKRWLMTVSSQLPYGGQFYEVEFPDKPPEEGEDYDFTPFKNCGTSFCAMPPESEIYALDIPQDHDNPYACCVFIFLHGNLIGQAWIIDEYDNMYRLEESTEAFVNKCLLNVKTN